MSCKSQANQDFLRLIKDFAFNCDKKNCNKLELLPEITKTRSLMFSLNFSVTKCPQVKTLVGTELILTNPLCILDALMDNLIKYGAMKNCQQKRCGADDYVVL